MFNPLFSRTGKFQDFRWPTESLNKEVKYTCLHSTYDLAPRQTGCQWQTLVFSLVNKERHFFQKGSHKLEKADRANKMKQFAKNRKGPAPMNHHKTSNSLRHIVGICRSIDDTVYKEILVASWVIKGKDANEKLTTKHEILLKICRRWMSFYPSEQSLQITTWPFPRFFFS